MTGNNGNEGILVGYWWEIHGKLMGKDSKLTGNDRQLMGNDGVRCWGTFQYSEIILSNVSIATLVWWRWGNAFDIEKLVPIP